MWVCQSCAPCVTVRIDIMRTENRLVNSSLLDHLRICKAVYIILEDSSAFDLAAMVFPQSGQAIQTEDQGKGEADITQQKATKKNMHAI